MVRVEALSTVSPLIVSVDFQLKANLGDIQLGDQKAMARKLEALIRGEDPNAEVRVSVCVCW